MPLYEFRCSKCKGEREVVQPFGADPPSCPQCRQEMERLISSPAVIMFDNLPLKYRRLGIK